MVSNFFFYCLNKGAVAFELSLLTFQRGDIILHVLDLGMKPLTVFTPIAGNMALGAGMFFLFVEFGDRAGFCPVRDEFCCELNSARNRVFDSAFKAGLAF